MSKFKLTLLTPLHIGAENDELTPMDFAFLNEKICCVLNRTRLFKKLKETEYKGENCLDLLLKDADKKQEQFTLTGFLHENGALNEEFLLASGVASYSMTKPAHLMPERIRPFIRNAYGQPYLPGTSIKGAMRTALLFCMVKEIREKKTQSEFEEFLSPLINLQKEKESVGEQIIDQIFRGYFLPGAKKYSANTDILRCLKVFDTKPLDKDSLVLKEVKILNRDPSVANGWAFTGDISVYAECIPEGTILEFDLKIDEYILNDFKSANREKALPLSTINDLLISLKNFSRECISLEKDFFDPMGEIDAMKTFYTEAYQGEEPILRLGWGSGILDTTIYSLLPDSLKERVVNRYFQESQCINFPRTRRVIVDSNSNSYQPLGWVRIEN